MFTGLVESLGVVKRVDRVGDGADLFVEATFAPETSIGESVAVNGACLTVVAREGNTLRFQAGFETLARTDLGELKVGHRVNLERALRFGDRLGGHLVSGHIDTIGRIAERVKHGEFELIWFACPAEWTRQMVPKGSIAVDGISLTLVEVTADRFSVMLIPHTLDATTLGLKHTGDAVNLETDLLAKYVQKQLNPMNPS